MAAWEGPGTTGPDGPAFTGGAARLLLNRPQAPSGLFLFGGATCLCQWDTDIISLNDYWYLRGSFKDCVYSKISWDMLLF